MKVYWYYFKAGGLATFFFMALSFLLSVGAKVVSVWWLAVWVSLLHVIQYTTNMKTNVLVDPRRRRPVWIARQNDL